MLLKLIVVVLSLIVSLTGQVRSQANESFIPIQQVTDFDSVELPEWFKASFLDLSEDNVEAQENDKHLVVMFWQDFCGYCKNMVEKNLSQKSIRDDFDTHFEVVALNIWGGREVYDFDGEETTEKEIARHLKVQFTPTLIFFDSKGSPVLRLNGYISPSEMKVALNFVKNKQYLSQSIYDYIASVRPKAANESLNKQPFISETSDNNHPKRLHAILFEQTDCPDCDTFHRCVLNLESVRNRFKPFHTVQYDLWSDDPITTPSGIKTTARKYAEMLEVIYAPSLLLFDSQGNEIIRVESQLRSFHTEAVLEYIARDIHLREPNFQKYIEERGNLLRNTSEFNQTFTTRDVCPELYE